MKKTTKKAAAKKATTKKAPAAKAAKSLGKAQRAVLKLLAKEESLTRAELTSMTGAFVGSSIAYTDKPSEPSSLAGRGLIEIRHKDGVAVYHITPAGRREATAKTPEPAPVSSAARIAKKK